MSVTNKIILGTLAADVANSGTFVVGYPQNTAPESGRTNLGDYFLATDHKLVVGSSGELSFPNQFSLAFAADTITVTNRSGGVLLAGTSYQLQLNERGNDIYAADGKNKMAGMKRSIGAIINLGAPIALSANAIRASAGVLTVGVNGLLNGALVANGVAVMDVPRNITVVSASASDTTNIVTVFGTDVYGVAIRENFALDGTTTIVGLKAFKTVTRITTSVTTVGVITAGINNRLGLPVFMPSIGHIVRELQDGLVATAGTLVAGVLTAGGSTATTGDVRGTYTPNAAPNGSITYELLVSLPDLGYEGMPQFNG